jgi:tetratricopeptide (TPR) repeat protein
MKIFGIKMAAAVAASFLGLATLAQPARLMAQATASIHGHVQNAAGMPVGNAEVRLSTEKNPSLPSAKFEYTFPVDANGDYKGTGIKPGNYIPLVFTQGKSIDFLPQTAFAANDDKAVDFDMTRKEYIDKMSPADRANLEEYKKTIAATLASNAKVGTLNALLKSARDANTAGKYDEAAKDMTDATAAKPDEAILWDVLGDAQLGQANAAAKAAHDAKTTDPTVADKYAAANVSYQKALELNAKLTKPDPKLVATVDNQLGQILGKTGKTKEAADAYDAAAKADPTKAAIYYYNETATLYNAAQATGDKDVGMQTAAAADKLLTADPTRADAFYLKAEGLALSLTTKPGDKPGSPEVIVAPPGLAEACNKYLELAPTGSHAQEMKDILGAIGEKIQSSYKAPKK